MTEANNSDSFGFHKDMRYDLRKPCDDCPFMRATPYHSGVAASLLKCKESIDTNVFSHSCHKTDNRKACDGPKGHKGPIQHCVGALLMILKSKDVPYQRPMLIATDDGRLDFWKWFRAAKADRKAHTLRSLMDFYYREILKRFPSLGGKYPERICKISDES